MARTSGIDFILDVLRSPWEVSAGSHVFSLTFSQVHSGGVCVWRGGHGGVWERVGSEGSDCSCPLGMRVTCAMVIEKWWQVVKFKIYLGSRSV